MIKQIRFAALSALMPFFSGSFFRIFYLFLQSLCRDSVGALSHNDDLFQPIRSRNRYLILSADPVDRLFNILVCCLGLFRVNHIDIMIRNDFFHMSLHFVGIKNKNQRTFTIPLIVT